MQLAPDPSVDTPANRWLNYRNLAHPDVRKGQITVGNFLDMTSGLDCDDNNDNSPGNEDTMQSQTQQPDWYRYMMHLPMVRDPGTPSAAYCSGGMNMTGAFVSGATHRWTPEFFDATIARPLQFGEYHLQLTPTGKVIVASYMEKNRILIALSESVQTKFGRSNFETQSIPQKVFSAIWSLESEVNNGGFLQYFQNSSAETAPSVLHAGTPEAIRAAANSLNNKTCNVLNALDQEIRISASR